MTDIIPKPRRALPAFVSGNWITLAFGMLMACATCGMSAQTDLGRTALPDPEELAAWVQSRETVFDDVLELQSLTYPHREGAVANAERIVELWNTIAAELPENDLLRQRSSYIAAKLFKQTNPHRAAKIAEDSIYPAWSASLYLKAGKREDSERMERLAQTREQQTKAFQKQIIRFSSGQENMTEWLLGQPVMDRIKFLTSGVGNPGSQQHQQGFSGFTASLPDNIRLRRVMTLYYQPSVEDNFNSIDGELNLAEPILRTTAKTFPEKLGKTYRTLVESGTGVNGWFTGPLRIPGDWGPTGNALKVTADLLHDAGAAKDEILAVAKTQAAKADNPNMRCRWLALVAYLEDGHPDMRTNPDAILIEKLDGTESQRRWALAWLPNLLAEAAPRTPQEYKNMGVPDAVISNAGKCATDEDQILLCNAIGTFPPPTGLEQVMNIASAQSSNLSVWRNAVDAIFRQYSRVRVQPARELDPVMPNPDFIRLLPALRKALYPRLSDKPDCSTVLRILAELQDPELDGQIARHLLGGKIEGTTFMQSSAATVSFYKHLQWPRTIAAFEALGKDQTFAQSEYAARLAKDLGKRN